MKDLAKHVKAHNSREKNEICVIEEMSELTKEICKFQRDRGNTQRVTEELGHVFLMCYTLMLEYEIEDFQVHAEAQRAVTKMYTEG